MHAEYQFLRYKNLNRTPCYYYAIHSASTALLVQLMLKNFNRQELDNMMVLKDKKCIHYGFLQVPNYSMIAFISAVEVLRMANMIGGEELYKWSIFTLDGDPVKASNGFTIPANGDIKSANVDALFVCGGVNIENIWSRELMKTLHSFADKKIILGSLCTGTYLLARAKLLDGYRCTIHWENSASLYEEFPQVILSDSLYEIDRDRYTCAGGSAPLDMFLHLIREMSGQHLAATISEQFMCERIRGNNDRQRIPLKAQIGTGHPKLTEAVSLMETNIEEPISLNELSQHIGISRRQLERLFQKYLSNVPTRYYLRIRLTKARQLLLQTNKPIVDISLACGFVSTPHFSKCYKEMFNIPPSEDRNLKKINTAHQQFYAPHTNPH